MDNESLQGPDSGDGQRPVPTSELPAGWSLPQPEKIPNPTYMPAAFALGVTLLLWGLTTSWIISLAGLVLIILAMVFWMGDIRHEH